MKYTFYIRSVNMTNLNRKEMKTRTGSTWDLNKPVRSSLFKGNGKLTGKIEYHKLGSELECMLEVEWDFGINFIFEQFLSQ